MACAQAIEPPSYGFSLFDSRASVRIPDRWVVILRLWWPVSLVPDHGIDHSRRFRAYLDLRLPGPWTVINSMFLRIGKELPPHPSAPESWRR